MKSPAKPTIADILLARRYDARHTPAPETVVLKIGGKRVGTLQNLVTFTGKQKQGKSRYISAAIAAGIRRDPFFSIELITPSGRPKIALFDTEQGEYDFYKQIDLIKTFSQISELPQNFDAYNTREDNPITILQMMEHYLILNPDCSVLFVDGILDLLIDFNNVVESKKLTNYLKKITKKYNCLVIGVIHRGKGNDTTVGNIGSMVDRLAQSVLKIEKEKDRGTFILTPDFMRSDADFEPIEIWNNNGKWEQCAHISDTSLTPVKNLKAKAGEFDISEHLENLPLIFSAMPELTYEEIIQNIKEVYAIGRNWAVDCVRHLRGSGIIFKNDRGKYTRDPQKKINL